MARELKKSGGIRWRLWLGLALFGLIGAATAMAALKTLAYVLTDPRFALSTDSEEALSVQGLHYADRAKVLNVFAVDLGRSAFSVPLAERRRRLLAIDWVEDASVSRVWPDRLLVRIRERKPVAFVSFPSGPMLVDAEGVLIALPPRANFAFPVIDGLREDDAGAQRRAGVNAFLRFERNMGYLANDVSEVDVADPNDIRIVARVENRAVELIVGDGDFAARYQNFVSHYQEIRNESPDAGTFDLRLDDRITARN
jgi:cell division protein FtsQ